MHKAKPSLLNSEIKFIFSNSQKLLQKSVEYLFQFSVNNKPETIKINITDIPPSDDCIKSKGLVKESFYDARYQFFFSEELYYFVQLHTSKLGWHNSGAFRTLFYFAYAVQNEILPKGGLPVHSCLLAVNGLSVLLVGDSGVGKTTCCNRVTPILEGHSDDLAFIVKKKNQYFAHPYMTMSECTKETLSTPRDIHTCLPLKAIFFLEQSNNDQVKPIPAHEASLKLYHAASLMVRGFDRSSNCSVKQKNTTLFNNACDIIKAIPSYRLKASLNGRFWEKIQNTMDLNV